MPHSPDDACAFLPLRPGFTLWRDNPLMQRWDILGTTRQGDTLVHLDYAASGPPSHQPVGSPVAWVSGELHDPQGPVHAQVYIAAGAIDAHAR